MNLVLEYLESDLEMVIKDKSVVFMPSDIKSWMLMTLRGLEHCHRCWILHRVCVEVWSPRVHSLQWTGYEAKQFADRCQWRTQGC